MILRLTIVLMLITNLSACRYWELYRFSEQFCAFDEYINLHASSKGLDIAFNTPTLKRSLLLRYLGSQPVSSTVNIDSSNTEANDSFVITKTATSDRIEFSFQLDYHFLDDTPLLASASLAPSLSKLFSHELIRPILQSFCTDDYDISSKQVVLWFKINDIEPSTLPTQSKAISIFGKPTATTTNEHNQSASLSYDFSFLSTRDEEPQDEAKQDNLQANNIAFIFTFDAQQVLSKIHIRYYRYDYYIDFTTSEGRLVVARSAQ